MTNTSGSGPSGLSHTCCLRLELTPCRQVAEGISHLPRPSSSRQHVAGISPTREQVTFPPPPWAGCRALLGEGAGAPPHPGAGRPHHARVADAAASPPQGPHSSRRRMQGEPAGAGHFPNPSGDRSSIAGRSSPPCVLFAPHLPGHLACRLPCTPWPSGQTLTNRVHGRGPHLGRTAGGATRKSLSENIQNGDYAKRFILEGKTNYPEMTARRRLYEDSLFSCD